MPLIAVDRDLLNLSLNGDEQEQGKARNKLRELLAAAPETSDAAPTGVHSANPLECAGCVSGCFSCRA